MGCGWPVNTNQLNQVDPYKEIYYPAHVMTAGAVETATWNNQRIASLQMTLGVWDFAPSVENDVYWTQIFKGGKVNWLKDGSIPKIKIKPVWFQNFGAEPSPVEYVYWQISIYQIPLGGRLNQANNLRGSWQSPVLGNYDISSGDATDQERAFKVSQYNGNQNPVANDICALVFQLERHGSDAVNDTFTSGDAHLIGVCVQYDKDYANNLVWPTP